jgi:transposase
MNEVKCWFVGVDWASENHRVRIADCCGKRLGERDFAHGGAGLAEMAAWLISVAGAEASAIHVAIEIPHGPIVETLLERGFNVYAINPKQLDRFRDRFSPAGAKDDSRDAEVLSDALRTDMRAFRKLALAEPLVIELREWSRMTDDLNGERNRLCNRLREQLWRYFPAMLELEQDLGAEWFLDLWELVPTPDKVMHIREASIAKILKSRRIRRVTAPEVLAVLRKPPVTVAPGTIEAASAHIRVLSERLRVVNRQLKDAHRQLDRLCGLLAEPTESEPGQVNEQRDAAILASCQETVGSSSPRCSQRDGKPSSAETITPCGLFVALLLSPSVPERAASSRDGSRAIRGSGTLSTTGLALPCSTMLAAVPSTPLCAFAVTATHVLSARSAIGCSMSPARCFATAPNLTPHWKAKKMLAKG